jgi:CubicO group peptidase (beta-lactamase class C family)
VDLLLSPTPLTVRLGSVSKIFTALLLYRAVDEGRVSLDDPVSKYAPKFSINDPFNTSKRIFILFTLFRLFFLIVDALIAITFRQIAAQMAGLPREAPCGFPCNLNTTQASYYSSIVHINLY